MICSSDLCGNVEIAPSKDNSKGGGDEGGDDKGGGNDDYGGSGSLKLERVIEVWENERCWLGRGFSRSGLLPTERKGYSTEDGTLGWKMVDDAGVAMLLGPGKRGWSFESIPEGDNNDAIESSATPGFVLCDQPADGPCDANGWGYMAEFGSSKAPSMKRGLLDFVRRRRGRRTAFFRPDHFLPKDIYEKCDFCDSMVLDSLSDAMLDALSLASLFRTGASVGSKTLTDALIFPLKAQLIDHMAIGKDVYNDGTETKPDYNPMVGIDIARERLDRFADDFVGRPDPLFNLLDPEAVSSTSIILAMPERRDALEHYFPLRERKAFARLLVKHIDRSSFKLHCWTLRCATRPSDTCDHRIVTCSNKGCDAKFSFGRLGEHDGVCLYKPIECTNKCGQTIPRGELDAHLKEDCNLRPAVCPMSVVGCNAVVNAQDVSKHLIERTDHHLKLIADRMMEYQKQFKTMSAQMQALEESNDRLERQLQSKAAEMADEKTVKKISDEVKKHDKRLYSLERK